MAIRKTQNPVTVLIDLPCTLFAVNLRSPLAEALAVEIARRFTFSPLMQTMADKIIAKMGTSFNGLHLRLEKDAKDWASLSGGLDALEQMYWTACENNGFTNVRLPVIVFSKSH